MLLRIFSTIKGYYQYYGEIPSSTVLRQGQYCVEGYHPVMLGETLITLGITSTLLLVSLYSTIVVNGPTIMIVSVHNAEYSQIY